MNTEEIQRYGKFVRHLLELSRDGQDDAVALLLDELDERQTRTVLVLMLLTEARMR